MPTYSSFGVPVVKISVKIYDVKTLQLRDLFLYEINDTEEVEGLFFPEPWCCFSMKTAFKGFGIPI